MELKVCVCVCVFTKQRTNHMKEIHFLHGKKKTLIKYLQEKKLKI